MGACSEPAQPQPRKTVKPKVKKPVVIKVEKYFELELEKKTIHGTMQLSHKAKKPVKKYVLESKKTVVQKEVFTPPKLDL